MKDFKNLLLLKLFMVMVVLLIVTPGYAQHSGSMLDCKNANSYATGSGISTPLINITIEAWIYHRNLSPEVQRYVTIGSEVAVIRYDGSASGGTGQLHFYIKTDGTLHSIRVDNILSEDKWIHIAGTWDGTTMKLYANGEEIGSSTPGWSLTAPNGDVMISSNSEYMNGYMDEVRIWNDARTQDEIRRNMFNTLTGSEAGLIHYWEFDETSGTTVSDAKGSVHLTLTNTSGKNNTSGAMAGPRNAQVLDGSSDFLVINSNSSLNVDNTLTIEAWVKPDDLTGRYAIYSTRKNNESGSFQLEIGTGDGGTNRVAVTGVNTWVAQTNDNAISTGVWTHIAYTRSGSGAGTHKIYINGAEQPLISDADYTFINNSSDKYIGEAASGALYDGLTDEIRLWNVARTARQIRENMCQVLSGSETGLALYLRLDLSDGQDLYDRSLNHNVVQSNIADRYVSSSAFNTFLDQDGNAWSTGVNWSRGAYSSSDNVGIPYHGNGSQLVYINSNYTCNNLSVNDGMTFDLYEASRILTVNGNVFCYEYPATGDGKIKLSGGSASHSIDGDFRHIELYDTYGAKITGSVGIAGNLVLTSGDMDLNGNTATLGISALLSETGGLVTGSSGTIQTTRSLSNISSENVAGLGAEITTTSNMGSTTIIRGHTSQTALSNESLLRYYDISPDNNSGLNATLVFHYDDSELNGISESDLALYRSTDGGTSWTRKGGAVNNTNHTMTLNGIDAFSRWTAFQRFDGFTESGISLAGVYNCAVAWGDYDNDGDLDILLTGHTGVTRVSKIYINDGSGGFSDSGISLTAVDYSSAAWGDYDNDGDLDILLAGYTGSARITKIYTNDGIGGFSDSGISLTGAENGSAAWGDYDNDGDLDILLTGWSGSSHFTKIYRNDGNDVFTNSGISLTPVLNSSVDWGDYDNDGYLDILLTGWSGSTRVSKIYKNDGNGGFTSSGISLTGVMRSSAAWGDYDNDGYLDILLTGNSSSGKVSKVYKNNGSGNFVEQTGISLNGVEYCSVGWGDYDNDGYLDILLTGSGSVSKVYKNDGAGGFIDTDFSLASVYRCATAWGDYDDDGDLDILLSGYSGSTIVSKIYTNDNGISNTSPNAPTNLSSSVNGLDVTLSWDTATDNETRTAGLNYNVRIGKTSGEGDVVGPMANAADGYRRIPALGNTNLNTDWIIKNLNGGLHYWSVQTIDNTFVGSDFASEGSFSVTTTPDAVVGNALDFDGTDDYVDVADAASFNSLSFTTEFWLKPDVLRTQACVYKKSGSGLYWRFFMSGTSGAIEFDALPGEIANCRTGNVAEAGKWLHIAASYDHTAPQTVKLYANGVLQSTATSIADMGGGSNKGLLFSNASSPFDGQFEEVRFWNVVRTEQQIRENMHKTLSGNEPGLVSYWQMNAGSGAVAEDNYFGNDGTLYNMIDDNWVESTVSTGGGVSNTQTETSGTVTFTDTDLEMNFGSHNSASITVTKINNGPNSNPPSTTYDEQYWVVNRFDSGSFDANLTFTISEDLTSSDETTPSQIKLYSRTSTSDASWSLVASASSVNAASETATFNNISSFSQFILCRAVSIDDFPGSALEFDGENDYVSIADNDALDMTTDYTLEAWICPQAFGSLKGIISKYQTSGAYGYYLRLTSVDPYRGLTFDGRSTAADVLTANSWYHVAAVNDNGTRRLYLNGIEQVLTGTANTVNSNDNPIRLASDYSGRYFNGMIDKVVIWNVVRTEEQIRDNMHNTLSGAESGLLSYYQFNESSGTTLADKISINDGTLFNMTVEDWVTSAASFGSDGAFVNTTDATTAGPSGGTIQATITSTPDDNNNLGIYQSGGVDDEWITSETFPSGISQRADILWGVVERGSVTSMLQFDYSSVSGVSDPSTIHLLKRDDALGSWTDVTAGYTHDTGNRTFTKTGVTDYSEFSIGEGDAVRVQTKILLEGPYDDASHEMTTSLTLPTTSPYSEDARTVSSIPADITDWVLVELRSTADGTAVVSGSALLHKDGRIVGDDGTTSYIEMSASAGDYFIVIKHRNHLAVESDEVHPLSASSSTLYDFTVDASTAYDKYYGGDAALLETGIYGMYAGDTNNSGIVTNSDKDSIISNLNSAGYYDADSNCSGIVTNSDKDAIIANLNKATSVN